MLIFFSALLLASSAFAWVHRELLSASDARKVRSPFRVFAAGILHTANDLSRMQTFINKGVAGTTSPQYETYVKMAANAYALHTYTMSTPGMCALNGRKTTFFVMLTSFSSSVAKLTSREAFEADAAAAYQNALVRRHILNLTWE